MKKILAVLLTACLLTLTVWADDSASQSQSSSASQQAGETQSTAQGESLNSEASVPSGQENVDSLNLYAQSAILMDAKTGQILYNKNMDEKMFPASITKIMTAILVIEKGNLQDTTVITPEAVFSFDRSATQIALTHDEVVTIEQMLYGMLLMSANDASNVLAEYLAGSLDAFPAMMNAKAKEIGANHTHFNNAHGLPDEDHYTTAHDMALITQYAMTLPEFAKVFGTQYYEMQPTNLQKDIRYFYNQNQMVVDDAYYRYDGAIGGKLGWTEEAGHTMVTVAERDGVELVAVVLKTAKSTQKYEDAIKLFDWGFSLKRVTIRAKDIASKTIEVMDGNKHVGDMTVTAEHDVELLVPSLINKTDFTFGVDLPDQINEGDPVPTEATITMKDYGQGFYNHFPTVPLKSEYTELVQAQITSSLLDGVMSVLVKVYDICGVLLMIVGVLIVLLVIIIFYIRYYNIKQRKQHRNKMRNVRKFERRR